MEIRHGLISADSHVVTEPKAFLDRMSKNQFGERIPQIKEIENKGQQVERWFVNGQPLHTRGVCNCPAVMGDPQRNLYPQRWEEVPAKAYLPARSAASSRRRRHRCRGAVSQRPEFISPIQRRRVRDRLCAGLQRLSGRADARQQALYFAGDDSAALRHGHHRHRGKARRKQRPPRHRHVRAAEFDGRIAAPYRRALLVSAMGCLPGAGDADPLSRVRRIGAQANLPRMGLATRPTNNMRPLPCRPRHGRRRSCPT